MIGALRGTLAALDTAGDHAVELEVDVQGVGYRVLVGGREAATLPQLGEPIALSIHTHVREGELTLYGFADRGARRAFELLLTAHGVGPALALAILAVLPPGELALAVEAVDLDRLCEVPGVGRKTAQRLCVDLASRLDVLEPAFVPSGPGAPVDGRSEVREALLALGYRNEEIRPILDGLPTEGAVEVLLREALRELAPQR
jgi:Holliday junction DNA helicase RuvA